MEGTITVSPNSSGGTAKLQAMGASGPTTFDSAPEWTNSDESVVTLEVSEDGSVANWTVTGTPGTSVLQATTTESNTGETFQATGTIVVVAEDITSIAMDLEENSSVETS